MQGEAAGGGVVALDEVRRFITDAMTAVGTPRDGAGLLADVLLEADYRGHYSHGLNRLGEDRPRTRQHYQV